MSIPVHGTADFKAAQAILLVGGVADTVGAINQMPILRRSLLCALFLPLFYSLGSV